MKETIRTQDDILNMLDALLREPTAFWDSFYEDRTKRIPFFVDKPNENLVAYVEQTQLPLTRVLELGSGPGRNALYLAERGSQVDAIDLAQSSIDWANERANERQLDVRFRQGNLFELSIEDGAYDFVYDSGCFHHIAPHRRHDYIRVVTDALRPGGCFALTCFVEGSPDCGQRFSKRDDTIQHNRCPLAFKEGTGCVVLKLNYLISRAEQDSTLGCPVNRRRYNLLLPVPLHSKNQNGSRWPVIDSSVPP